MLEFENKIKLKPVDSNFDPTEEAHILQEKLSYLDQTSVFIINDIVYITYSNIVSTAVLLAIELLYTWEKVEE